MITELLKKGNIGSVETKNRIIFPSMCQYYCDSDGCVTTRLKEFVRARAAGGTGIIIIPGSPHGTPGPARPALSDRRYFDGWRELVEICHGYGCKLFVQIHPAKAQAGRDPKLMMPDAMELSYIRWLIESYARCAGYAKEAGLDGVEIHGAHAHEIAQFLSPYYNHRTDEYGGDELGRSRFYREIVSSIKQTCGKDFPVICRISTSEKIEGGREADESVKIAALLEQAGADAIHASVGMPLSEEYIAGPMDLPAAFNEAEIRQIKQAVSIPVIAVNRIISAEIAERLLAEGTADFAAIGRGMLADENFVNKINTDLPVRQCLGCNQGCRSSVAKKAIYCVQNPRVGREATLKITEAPESLKQKKILIIGAGPAGLEAAMVLGMRGVKPVVWEANASAGGRINLAKLPPCKSGMDQIIRYRLEMFKRMGIPVVTGQKATKENIAQLNPDMILAATGSRAVLPNIPGLYDENGRQYASVMTGDELLENLQRLESIRESGKKAAILGGGLIGTEVADLLCSYGVPVELFELKDRVAEELNKGRRVFVMKRLKEGQARIHTQAKITRVSLPDVFAEINGKEERFSDFGAVIVALGRTNRPSFAQQLKDIFPEKQVIALGDADVPGMAMAAITQAAITAAEL